MPGWRVGDYELLGKRVLKNGSLEKCEHKIYYNLDEFMKTEEKTSGKK
jgi:hypothetical protein